MDGNRDPTALADYHERRIVVREKFERVGWGSRSRAAFDLRMHATHVSNTLNGVQVNDDALDRLEAWADAQLQLPLDNDPVLVQERLNRAAGMAV